LFFRRELLEPKIEGDPTIGIERRSVPPDRTRALVENQIAALWRLDVALREKTQWKMLYESAARADEALCLNVEDLYPQDKRGKITSEGGATEWIHWQSGHRPAAAQTHRPPCGWGVEFNTQQGRCPRGRFELPGEAVEFVARHV